MVKNAKVEIKLCESRQRLASLRLCARKLPQHEVLFVQSYLLLNQQLVLRQHRRQSFVLPTAHWTVDAAGAGFAFLRARAAGVNLFRRERGSRCGWGRRLNRAFDDQRWPFAPAATSDQHPRHQQNARGSCPLQPVRPSGPAKTVVAKLAAGPNTPAQPHDLIAAFATEVWPVTCEERQRREVLSYYKQPALYKATDYIWRASEIRTFEKSPVGGHTFRADFPMNYQSYLSKIPRQLLLLTLFALATAASAAAQEVDDVVRTETSLVQLNVGVVDKQGRPIKSLTRSDFVIYEDGVKQSIQHFEPVDAPFSLVLMLDMSGSTVNFRQQLKLASQRFLDALAPEDRVAVIQFNAKVKSLAGFSTDRLKASYAIEIADGAGETHFYEALKYALKELEKEGQRRKAIVVLTDGLDTSMRNSDRSTLSKAQTDEEALATIDPHSSPQLKTVLAAADRQGVTIFPLALPSGDPKRLPLQTPGIVGIYAAARARLQSLADRTGGRLNEIDRLQYMAQLYREVAANLRSLYTVAYQPQGERIRGKWHEIKVEVANADLTARAKPGYFAR